MIFYVTAHWKSSRWIDIQRTMIARYTDVPYKTYAYLHDIDKSFYSNFDVILDQDDPPHNVKLDSLAKRVIADATSEDDWIVFIDGDAFPIANVHAKLSHLLQEHKLIAVKRLENLGEKQPHPCFCVTTAGLWKSIHGTWAPGYKWLSSINLPTTDVGGELLRILENHAIQWLPLYRTNTVNLNPVFYAIYGNIIYHHGAGFRLLGCRQIYYDAGLFEIYKRIDARILNNIVPAKYLKRVRDAWIHPEGRRKRKIHKELAPQEHDIFLRISKDPEYVRTLMA